TRAEHVQDNTSSQKMTVKTNDHENSTTPS
ncbi:hypothetical protein Rin_00003520, partial [Candidatus Regiella insecticola 5.15]